MNTINPIQLNSNPSPGTWVRNGEDGMAPQKQEIWQIIQMFLFHLPLKHMKCKNLSNF
jgi:hypothetical protein